MSFRAIGSTFATDMTLALGAESYIVQSHYPSDPNASMCLQNFVDLFLNADEMYFTLPGDQDEGTPGLIANLLSDDLLQPFKKGAVELLPKVENKVYKGFVKLVKIKGHPWVKDWINFQVVNPIVTKGHKRRVHEKGEKLISESGYQFWNEKREKLVNDDLKYLLEDPKLSLLPEDQFSVELREYTHSEMDKFSSPNEFLLCYALDVYRRGWQYAEGVRVAGEAKDVEAKYFPHELRINALTAATDKWEPVPDYQKYVWSWGRYIVNLLAEPEYQSEKSPEKVVQYMLKIRETMRKEHFSIWADVPIFDEHNRIREDERFKNRIKQLQEEVLNTAHKAGLPQLRIKKDTPRVKAASIFGDTVTNIATNIALPASISTILGPIIGLGKIISLTAEHVSPEWVTTSTKAKREVISWFSKGTFGYRGLTKEK